MNTVIGQMDDHFELFSTCR